MKNQTLMKCGVCGTCIMAVCCFTPLLVIVLGAFGLSAWLGWLDYVLLPGLALFIVLTSIAGARLLREKRDKKARHD